MQKKKTTFWIFRWKSVWSHSFGIYLNVSTTYKVKHVDKWHSIKSLQFRIILYDLTFIKKKFNNAYKVRNAKINEF